MTLKDKKKKQTTTQREQNPLPEKPVKATYYDGLQEQQDEFDREMLSKAHISKKTDTSQPGTDSKTSKQGVFLKRGKGQSFDEYKKACIKSLRDAGLIKAKSTTPSEEPPDRHELQASELIEKGLEKYKDKYVSNPESTTPNKKNPGK